MATANQDIPIKFDGEDDHDWFPEETDISENFDFIQQCYRDYEDCTVKVSYDEALRILKKLETSIIRHGMFSPNEGVEEIATENLKYLLLPFYLADIFGRIQENRKSNLKMTKTYYDEFIKLCNHYELVTKEQRKKWKTVFDDMNYEPTREDKIQGFKDKKDLENKLKNLEKIKDEDTVREIVLTDIRMKILKAIDDIRMVHMEMQLQDHKEKMEKERQANPELAAKQKEQEPKKMKVWHVPKPQKNPEQPYLMDHQDWGCNKCDPLYNMKAKEEMQSKVFQPGYGQPTMRLEEFANMAMEQFDQQDKAQKAAQAEREIEEAKDQDRDDIVDKKTLEERAWDDWKDENEKGAGNKNKNLR